MTASLHRCNVLVRFVLGTNCCETDMGMSGMHFLPSSLNNITPDPPSLFPVTNVVLHISLSHNTLQIRQMIGYLTAPYPNHRTTLHLHVGILYVRLNFHPNHCTNLCVEQPPSSRTNSRKATFSTEVSETTHDPWVPTDNVALTVGGLLDASAGWSGHQRLRGVVVFAGGSGPIVVRLHHPGLHAFVAPLRLDQLALSTERSRS